MRMHLEILGKALSIMSKCAKSRPGRTAQLNKKTNIPTAEAAAGAARGGGCNALRAIVNQQAWPSGTNQQKQLREESANPQTPITYRKVTSDGDFKKVASKK